MRRNQIFATIIGLALATFLVINVNQEKEYLVSREIQRLIELKHTPQTVSSDKKTLADKNITSEGNFSWTQHMDKYCKKFKDRVQTTKGGVSQFADLIYNDEFKVIFCPIAKVASSNWERMFLILSGKMNTTDPEKILSRDIYSNYGTYRKTLGELDLQEIKYRLKHYHKFMIVREPFERLLSAYRNKLGQGSTKNGYFHMRYGRSIIEKFRKNPSNESLKEGHDVKFSEFVNYITDPKRREPLNNHWVEYHERCKPCIVNYDNILKYESLTEDSNKLIKKIGASNIIQFPSRSQNYHHKQTSELLYDYYKTLSSSALRKLYKLYEADFGLFNYSIPKSIQNLTDTLGS